MGPWNFSFATGAAVLLPLFIFFLPELVRAKGLPAANLALLAISIPLFSLIFVKRLWVVSRLTGSMNLPLVVGDYFGGKALPRLIGAIVIFVNSSVVIAMIISATHILAQLQGPGNETPRALTGFVIVIGGFAILTGGFRLLKRITPFQAMVVFAGGLALVTTLINQFQLAEGISKHLIALAGSSSWPSTQGKGGGVFPTLFALSGYMAQPMYGRTEAGIVVIELGGWSVMSSLTAFIGVAALSFITVTGLGVFSLKSPRSFSKGEVVVSSLGYGALGLSVIVLLGFVLEGGQLPLWIADIPVAGHEKSVTSIYNVTWISALVAILSLVGLFFWSHFSSATMASLNLGPIGEMRSQSVIGHMALRQMTQLAAGSALIILIIWAANQISDTYVWKIVLLEIVLAVGAQLIIPLICLLWMPWINRNGVLWGVLSGLATIVVTGFSSSGLAGLNSPAGIHPLIWGLAINGLVCVVFSALIQNEETLAERRSFHRRLMGFTELAPEKKDLRLIAWIATLAWLFFAIGPGAIIGNGFFGSPDDPTTWDFGIPSIWAWQILFWALGVVLVWFLAEKMELGTMSREQVDAVLSAAEVHRKSGSSGP